jgi:uridine phosphorylase
MIKKSKYPILEFDPAPHAYFDPGNHYSYKGRKFPERVVICFFKDVIEKLVRKDKARKIAVFRSESGFNPAYEITVQNKKIGVLHPGIGSPAAAAFLDEAIAMGGKKFIACGGAGVLRKDLTVGHLIIPISAIRDEGASYHYIPPGREVQPHPQGLKAIRKTLNTYGYPFVEGKTWTTDGFYRETKDKIALRKKEGCLCVEMECAAFFAVAKFRKVRFGQILYSGDDLSGATHDDRQWHERVTIREKVFWLAAEACASI